MSEEADVLSPQIVPESYPPLLPSCHCQSNLTTPRPRRAAWNPALPSRHTALLFPVPSELGKFSAFPFLEVTWASTLPRCFLSAELALHPHSVPPREQLCMSRQGQPKLSSSSSRANPFLTFSCQLSFPGYSVWLLSNRSRILVLIVE